MSQKAPDSMRGETLFALGAERIHALCRALGFSQAQEQRMVEVFATLSTSWGQLPAGSAPRWPSDITDDGTPFEFSLAIDGEEPELRFLIEAQTPESPTLASNWFAGWALCERLEREPGVSLERLRLIEDLFVPTAACPRFALWHAVCFRKGRAPDFKVYLNPMAWGREQAHALVAEAMRRLGMAESVVCLPERTSRDVPVYFSLDLASRQGARVKVYTEHREVTASRVESLLRQAPGYEPGQVEGFCRAMAGSQGPYVARPVLTCLAFVEGSPLPSMGTVHFPVRTYAEDDRAARDRILAFLRPEAAALYARAISAFAARPLEAGIGMQTYASLRQQRAQRRLTVYLAPEVFAVRPAQPALPPGVLEPEAVTPVRGGALHTRS